MKNFILSPEQFERLSSYNINLTDIYEANPYDHQRNWSGKLSEKLFDEVFRISSDFLDAKMKDLTSQVDLINGKKIIFFTGYSGTGKTTFINHFIAQNKPEAEFICIDYSQVTEDVVSKENTPISDGIKYFIVRNYIPNDEVENDKLYETINFIYNNFNSFLQLISNNSLMKIVEYVETPKINEIDKYSKLNQLLDSFDSMDVFIILLIILFKHTPANKKNILIFENLDIIELDYLTGAFINDFQKLHNNCSTLSQKIKLFGKEVMFSKRFKFIFVLREATFAKNPHIVDQLGNGWSQFIYANIDSHSHDVLLRRVAIVEEMERKGYGFTNEEKDVNQLIKYFSTDKYFDESTLNLFNRDVKKIVRVFLEVFKRNKEYQIPYVLHRSDFENYEKRGAIIYWVVGHLKENSYFDNIFSFNYSTTREEPCDIGRALLTYLLNHNGLLFNKEIRGDCYKDEICKLSDIIQYFDKVYSVEDILCFLTKGYLLHKKQTWVNVLSIYNKEIQHKNAFNEELEFLQKNPQILEKDSKDDIKKKIMNTEVSITPAGYSLIKYIFIHFEYYSNRIKKENSQLKHPLFYLGLKKNKFGRYLFEDKINNVLNILKKEFKDSFTFFNKTYLENKKLTSKLFEESEFSFKYLSTKRKSRNGVFHITRVTSSQIAYIDNFRVYLLNKESVKNNKNEIALINTKIINLIREYIDLINKYSLDSRKDFIVNTLETHIGKIENDLSNIEARIMYPEQID